MSAASVLTEKFQNLSSQVRHLPAVLSLTFSVARKCTIRWAFLLAAQGLVPVATIYLTRSLIEMLSGAAPAHPASRADAIQLVLALFAIYLLGKLLSSAIAWVRSRQADLIHDHLNGLIHRKAVELDLQFYETPDGHDQLHRARIETDYRSVALLESLARIAQNLITLLVMLVVLLPFGVWVPLALLASTIPAFLVVLACGVRQYGWRRRITHAERRTWYHDWPLTAAPVASELRLFDLGFFFREQYQQLRATLREERKLLITAQLWAECAAATFGVAISAAATLWVILQTSSGRLTLGNAVLFCLAFQNGLRLMHSLLSGLEQLYSNRLFLRDLFDLLSLDSTITDPVKAIPAPQSVPEIRFREVTFRYPGSQSEALRGFELLIPPRKMVALVGANGSGKSTFLKLVCRLYDPASGSIEMDGVDLRLMRVADVRSRITVLFQEPVRYYDTVAENIVVGSLPRQPSVAAIRSASEAAGAGGIVGKLPEGYATMLGKSFSNGNDLSVGEWQRIAFARAVRRQSQILILDEPTSAMDPWAETEWLTHFRALAQEQTCVVITHRFTTASHADMLQKGGRYAESWTAQMQTAIHV